MSYQGTLGYQGGKSHVAGWITEQCPPAEFFVDVFGGSGSVALAAVRCQKFAQVIYNDADREIFDTLICIRDRCEELIEFLEQTPLGKEGNQTIYTLKNSKDDLERAAGCVMQLARTIFTPTLHNNEYNRTTVPSIRSKGSIGGGYKTWAGKLGRLKAMQRDLLKVFFENRHWETIVNCYTFTSKATVSQGPVTKIFFLDPPYGKTQDYKMTADIVKVVDYFKKNDDYTIKMLCGEEGTHHLKHYEYIPFPYGKNNNKKEYKHGIYIHDRCLRGKRLL